MKVLYLCLIIIHSLLHGTRALQGVPHPYIIFPSAAFYIWIFGLADRCEKGRKKLSKAEITCDCARMDAERDSSDLDADPLHRAPAPCSLCCCDTAMRSRAELQELAEVGVPLMIAGPSWYGSVGMTSLLCWSRLTKWLYRSFLQKRAWLTSCAGKQLRYLFTVKFVSPWNCIKMQLLFFYACGTQRCTDLVLLRRIPG